MSPEQIEFGAQSPRSDIYSLAIVAFELLTGHLPFNVSVTPFQQMRAKISGELLDPQFLNPLIADNTRDVLRWGLRTDRAERPASALEFLGAFMKEEPVPVSKEVSGAVVHGMPQESVGKKKRVPESDHSLGSMSRDSACIFVSYSRKDEKWLEKLSTHLKPLTRATSMQLWSDRKIDPGDLWREELEKHLKSATVAVLLASPNFLASEFIAENELPPLLAKAQADGLRILWISVSACLYKESPLAQYQAVNDPEKPLDRLSPAALNRQLVDIAERIKNAMES